jgi:nitrous oxidase accessory protein NosD
MKKPLPTSVGNWLYVGGSGPGNYTSIQEAIDNASSSDTVFVYDDSAPYHEIITIDRSITLLGENRNSTIIDGSGRNLAVIMIIAENVTVQGFTLIDSDPSIGVIIKADNTTISNLWIRNIQNGMIIEALNTTSIIKNCLIQGNIIEGANIGLYTDHAWNVTISNNLLRDHDAALALIQSFDCTVSANLIMNSHVGLTSINGAKNLFTQNTIITCEEGLYLEASNDQVINNNFLNVTRTAYFYRYPWFAFMFLSEARLFPEYEFNHIYLKEYRVFGTSVWSGNYWNEPRTLPYPIPGWRGSFFIELAYFRGFPPTRLAFDLHPAQKSYDLPIVPS